MVYEAIQACEKLAEMGINARIINMSTIKPLDEELVLKAAKECGKIITCEEHSVIGGLGEAVCSFLSETYPVPVKRIGVNDEFGFSGPAAEVLKAFGLSADNIVNTTREFLNK
jgi:transketolase